jgi:S-adenosylmethionine hydrolase
MSRRGLNGGLSVRRSAPTSLSAKQIRGSVIHIDRFGNIITTITSKELTEQMVKAGPRVRIGKHEANRLLTHFGEASQNELFAYFGSAGLLELAVPRQQAARIIDAHRGMEVDLFVP